MAEPQRPDYWDQLTRKQQAQFEQLTSEERETAREFPVDQIQHLLDQRQQRQHEQDAARSTPSRPKAPPEAEAPAPAPADEAPDKTPSRACRGEGCTARVDMQTSYCPDCRDRIQRAAQSLDAEPRAEQQERIQRQQQEREQATAGTAATAPAERAEDKAALLKWADQARTNTERMERLSRWADYEVSIETALEFIDGDRNLPFKERREEQRRREALFESIRKETDPLRFHELRPYLELMRMLRDAGHDQPPESPQPPLLKGPLLVEEPDGQRKPGVWYLEDTTQRVTRTMFLLNMALTWYLDFEEFRREGQLLRHPLAPLVETIKVWNAQPFKPVHKATAPAFHRLEKADQLPLFDGLDLNTIGPASQQQLAFDLPELAGRGCRT